MVNMYFEFGICSSKRSVLLITINTRPRNKKIKRRKKKKEKKKSGGWVGVGDIVVSCFSVGRKDLKD